MLSQLSYTPVTHLLAELSDRSAWGAYVAAAESGVKHEVRAVQDLEAPGDAGEGLVGGPGRLPGTVTRGQPKGGGPLARPGPGVP